MSDNADIPGFLDRRPLIGTYTMLNNFDNVCPHQTWHRYILKDVPFVETPEMKWGNDVHSAFEYRISGGKPLPATMQRWEPFAAAFSNRGAQVEMKLGISQSGAACEYFAKDVRFRVKVDLALIGETSAYIADWKTGGSKYEHPYELEIGAMHLHAKYPSLKSIKGRYVWLKEERFGAEYDLSDTLSTWKKANAQLAAMEEARKTDNWPKRKGPLCGYCNVKSCENWYEAKSK